MTLFKYFKRVDSKGKESIPLPAENGSLSQVIPPVVIKEANDSVSDAVKLQGKRNPYLKSVTPTTRASLLTATAYRSCGLPSSRTHVKVSSIIGSQMF